MTFKVHMRMHQPTSAAAVLIVEDEVLIAMHLTMVLEDAGLAVCGVAANGAAALEIAAKSPPKIAIVDIRLGPGLDGIAVAHHLRRLYNCPIIFVSGSAERATLERTQDVAGSVFLQKPVEPERLIERLHDLLSAA